MRPAIRLLIRPYRPGDAPALRHVFEEAVHRLAAADYTEAQRHAWAPRHASAEVWAARMDALRPFVAEIGGAVAGYADLQPEGLIDHLFVAPAFARQGVGRALLEHVLDAARTRTIPSVYANVSRTAEPLFRALGFAVEARQTVVRAGVTLGNARMRRTV